MLTTQRSVSTSTSGLRCRSDTSKMPRANRSCPMSVSPVTQPTDGALHADQIPQGMVDLIKKDADKGVDDLF